MSLPPELAPMDGTLKGTGKVSLIIINADTDRKHLVMERAPSFDSAVMGSLRGLEVMISNSAQRNR